MRDADILKELQEYELREVKTYGTKDFWFATYNVYDDIFNLNSYNFNDMTVADVGCGANKGLFSRHIAKDMWVIEPCINGYKKQKRWPNKPSVHEVEAYVEDVHIKDTFDMVFTTNAIDHGYDVFKALDKIYAMLKKDGLLLLHVHCRMYEQLNKGHRQAFNPNSILYHIKQLGFTTASSTVYDYDVASCNQGRAKEKMYTTLIGVFRK